MLQSRRQKRGRLGKAAAFKKSTDMANVLMQRALFSVLVLTAALLAFASCTGSGPTGTEEPPTDEALDPLPAEFQRMVEVWRLLEREHIDGGTLDPQQLSDGAIRGMLQALDDPYAGFLTAAQYDLESQDIQGFFEGIGAEVGVRDGQITILAPIPDTPAEEAGIRPGDVILEIEGESTRGMSLLEVIGKIRGEKGTPVQLLVRHSNSGESELLTIVRGVIPLDSVSLVMQVGRIGYLRISSFTATTNQELEEALARFERSQGVGLVVDMRNNPGGFLSTTVDVTSQFLEDGLVLYQVDAAGERTEWHVKSGGKAQDIPMVVLVNEYSASASEVFLGAIKHHGRATSVGATTFGKGAVNNLWRLSDGSGVNFTIAHWFTPDDVQIEGEGIPPDIVVESSEDESEDLQLDKALEVLKEQIAQGG